MATKSNRFHGTLLAAAFISTVDIFPTSASTWSKDGHQVIGDIAFALAKPATQADIKNLISSAHPD